MPQPTPSDVHVNRPLTNISVAYLQKMDEFVSNKVFPAIPVQKKSDSYFIYDREAWFRTDAQKRGLSMESAGSGYTLSQDTYFAEVQALHKDIDDQLRGNADQPLNMDADATEFVTRSLVLRREKDFAAKYFTTGLWIGSSTGTDIVPGTLWDVAGSTPIVDIRNEMVAQKKITGYKPNCLLLADDVWAKLQDNADFLDRITITKDKIVTTSLLAALLELDKVMVASVVENTAAEGQTMVGSYLYTKDALLCYAAPRPSLMQPSAGYTFNWTGYLGASAEGTRMKRMRLDWLNSDRIEGEIAYDQKVVAADMGCFFNNVIS